MSSGYGLGGIFQVGDYWHVRYSNHGNQIRESTGIRIGDDPAVAAKARKFLQKRLVEIAAGKFTPQQDKLSVEDVLDAFLARYRMEERRSIKSATCVLNHVRDFFRGYRAIQITGPRLRDYVNKRKEDDAADASIHRELAHLRTALKLAVADGRLSTVPPFPNVRVDNAKEGFLEPAEFERLRAELPEALRDYATFLYLSGWRSNEVRLLEWRDVDLEAGEIKLRPANSKTNKPRTLPLFGEIKELIERLYAERRRLDSRYVFCRWDGRPFGYIGATWKNAAKRAGLRKLTPHDCRRSAVRNLVRSGISQHVCQAWTGHKTASVFARYNITSPDDLKLAADKLTAYVESQQQKPATVLPFKTSEKLAKSVRKAG